MTEHFLLGVEYTLSLIEAVDDELIRLISNDIRVMAMEMAESFETECRTQ